jgi:tripartite-type tricarboxylate transporter receptor subunit TctC
MQGVGLKGGAISQGRGQRWPKGLMLHQQHPPNTCLWRKKMGLTHILKVSGIAVAAAALMAGASFAQSVEEFYKGKSLTMLVSAPAGSLTDIAARQFAPFYGKHIPGGPDVVVLNIAGAGGMVAAAALQSKQPSDGTSVGFLQRNNMYVPLLDPKQNSFDPREVHWLGSLDKVYYCIVAMPRSGIETTEDLFAKPLVIGATGFANENRTLPALLNELIGTKMNIIPGYSDRGEVYLAMARGEVDGWASTIDGLLTGEPARMLADGTMRVLMHIGWESHPDFPDVPNLSDYITDPAAKSQLDFFLLPLQAGRPLAVPKDVPQDRLDALRAAFDATVADPEFLAVVEAQNMAVDAINGARVEEIVASLYATPEAQLESARKLMTEQ